MYSAVGRKRMSILRVLRQSNKIYGRIKVLSTVASGNLSAWWNARYLVLFSKTGKQKIILSTKHYSKSYQKFVQCVKSEPIVSSVLTPKCVFSLSFTT